MPSLMDDPQHCLDRADEARAHAKEMREPDARQTMLAIAEGYEKMAKRARERLASRKLWSSS